MDTSWFTFSVFWLSSRYGGSTRTVITSVQKACDENTGIRSCASLDHTNSPIHRVSAEAFEAEVMNWWRTRSIVDIGIRQFRRTSGKPGSKRWKHPVVLPGQTDVTLVVDDIDGHYLRCSTKGRYFLPVTNEVTEHLSKDSKSQTASSYKGTEGWR